MATYFDPKSWSQTALDFGKRLLDPGSFDQWIAFTTSWMDPVAEMGSGTVTALMPDVVLTVLSEGILSRFGGQEVTATLLDHDLTATLDVLKVRRRGAHFQTKTVLSGIDWDGHPIEELTVIGNGVRLVPGAPTRLRCQLMEIEGVLTLAALVEWLNAQQLDWRLTLDEDGRIIARHRKRKLSARVEAHVRDNLLSVDIQRANWLGIRLPRRAVESPTMLLRGLPNRAAITYAEREDDHVRFRLTLPDVTGSFDLAQIRSAIVEGATLIIF